MAKQNHYDLLMQKFDEGFKDGLQKEGPHLGRRLAVERWNIWRAENPDTRPILSNAGFGAAPFPQINLEGAYLRGASLGGAYLGSANLEGSNLEEADLSMAYLGEANLERAILHRTNLYGANLEGASLNGAILSSSILANTNLSQAKGLETCEHQGPSIVDHRTLQLSKNVPINFWRGCGLPDALIDYLPSLLSQAIQFYSCFISYSTKDHEFAARLHADLQNAGVRCWFAPHDLPIGAKTWDGIDEAIRLREKVVLVLSKSAIASDWVEDEVTTAFEEERRRGETMLFPIRLDDVFMETSEAWASKLRARNVGDFRRWKEHDAYKATFKRVLRDLKKAT